MVTEVALLVNQTSGGGRAVAVARRVADYLRRSGVTVDLGRTTGESGQRWFGTVLAGGFDAKVTDRTNRLSWPRGKARYNLAILIELAALKPMEYVIEMDGQRWETSAMLVAVGNGQSYGGGMRICPSGVDDDGRFDITVIGETSVGRLLRVFPEIYKGRHVESPRVKTYRARS